METPRFFTGNTWQLQNDLKFCQNWTPSNTHLAFTCVLNIQQRIEFRIEKQRISEMYVKNVY